jgi:hypothetical protein
MRAALIMDAFVSHSSEDAVFAARLVTILEREGIPCWLAPRDIRPGDDSASAILDALANARCVALIFTEQANKSPHVLREIERAVNFRTPIVPLLLHNTAPTGSFGYLLATVHWVSGTGRPEHEATTLFANAVREFGNSRPTPQ